MSEIEIRARNRLGIDSDSTVRSTRDGHEYEIVRVERTFVEFEEAGETPYTDLLRGVQMGRLEVA